MIILVLRDSMCDFYDMSEYINYVRFIAAISYIHGSELPEVFKLRIEILMDQHCEDIALNLLQWCLKSSLFDDDVFVRKTYLCLLHKLENEHFHTGVSAVFFSRP